ncbi:hypothetical protein OPIT5_12595 [Opitutaceae bacterium TAV5]|nr:hypothetical protein OPIT5_12595 [Opitutaceae bacterium TAV5]
MVSHPVLKTPRKKVSIRDLARELGLSDRAVSQALNPRESNVKLSPATLERVQKLASKRGYRVDTSARAMRYGRFFNIGYFEASRSVVHYPRLGAEAGVFDAASEHGYHVVLVKIPADLTNNKSALPIVFRQSHLDALVVVHQGNLPPAYAEAIDASGLPVVYLNEKRATNSVYVDDIRGAAELTTHLLDKGLRRIAFLRGNDDSMHYSLNDRQSGCTQALAARGLKPAILDFGAGWEPKVESWLQTKPGIDAIFCPDDLSALRLIRILYRLDIRVPDQLVVAGYNGDFSREAPVAMPTMDIPFYAMARAAAGMAVRLVEDKAISSLPSQVFASRLIPDVSVETASGLWRSSLLPALRLQ